MFRGNSIVALFVVLTISNVAGATVWCARSSRGGTNLASRTRCVRAQETAASMACCRHNHHCTPMILGHKILRCCQLSAPSPMQPDPALPANSSDDVRLQGLSQLLNVWDPVSSSTLTYLPAGWMSLTVAFCPDRSDTYLLTSIFRI